ncbi:MacS family sensor histidine kinase [Streptomyces polyrhachis]|uniref:MacS family sensor histidine kinase n=1 Tax=Streptomyces polyrhachis TaxID=1282885 RepID=A0ABW2GCM7_9ACTN
MSVEQPLWTALTWFRVLTLGYALIGWSLRAGDAARPWLGWAFMAALTVWTVATFRRVSSAERCTFRFLAADIGMALTGILLTMAVETPAEIKDGAATLPSIWTAGAVLGFAIKGGWRWGAAASTTVGVSNIIERGAVVQGNVHNIVLLMVAATAIGYIVEVARASERTLARALQIEAATRERERLARDIHDGVLQVLSMVQRRGAAIGGEAAELGALAGEQEIALRTLVTGGGSGADDEAYGVQGARAARGARLRLRSGRRSQRRGGPPDAPAGPERAGGPVDLRPLLAPYAGTRVSYAEPGTPVLLPRRSAQELAAAVGAALDNVEQHAGPGARAWILLEDEPDAVVVTVRDDGPGIPAGRLAAARGEGRLGVAQSILGRIRDIGGTVEIISPPGQGTEVELRAPR